MFLERFLIGNLWNAGMICIALGLKWLLRNRLSLRFQYHCWYILLISLMLSFVPSRILPQWGIAESVGQQTFALSGAASQGTNASYVGTGWLQDTTELIAGSENSLLSFALLFGWLVGVLVMIGIYGCGSYRLRMMKQLATEPAPEVRERFESCCVRLGLKKRIKLRHSKAITAPVSFGLLKPYIVLPETGLGHLSDAERDHVLLHELTHIRHGDLITNYLFCGVQAIFWINPMVWVALRQMRRDREAYCDWAVMNELPDEAERINYGQTILHFAVGNRTKFHTANGLCQGKEQLKYRLERIVSFQQETKWKRFLGRCFVVALAVISMGQIPVLAYCTETTEEYYTPAERMSMAEGDWDSLFTIDGCAVIYDMGADLYTAYNEPEVTRRVPPCSTYKIYSALNALEQGIITTEQNTLAWDGVQYSFDAWNQDQTLYSAMQESVNWYFQTLDQAAGKAQLEDFFKKIGYGNCYLGSDPDNYWNGSGLKISALEQVELLVKLYRNDFGFVDANIAAVKDSMALGKSCLYGKTGTGRLDDTNVAGWFIGYLEESDNTYFVAVYLSSQEGADGALAYETAVRILEEYNK